MKAVLVSHHFERAQRVRTLARSMADNGHDVIVLTADDAASLHDERDGYRTVVVSYDRGITRARRAAGVGDEVNLAEAAHKRGTAQRIVVTRLARLYEALLLHPDKYAGWISACRLWLRGDPELADVDVVIAAAAPPSAHRVGELIADHCDAPLLLDFQDLWVSGNPYYPFGRLRRRIDRREEARLVSRADAVVTFSNPFTSALQRAYVSVPISTIYLGIDPAPWRHEVVPRSDRFTVAHFGTTYGGKRDISPLLRALARLGRQGRLDLGRVKVELWGEYDFPTRALVTDLDLDRVVHAMGTVPPADVPGALAPADVALLLMWPEDRVNFPHKICQYLAAGKHILVLGAATDSEAQRQLEGLPGVDLCADDASVEAAVAKLYDRWSAGETLDVDEMVRPFAFSDERMYAEFLHVIDLARKRHVSRR